MKPYLLSLAAGALVGGIYALLGVRSPAPPTIALLGLLGMLIGEQAVPVARKWVQGEDIAGYIRTHGARHVLGSHVAPHTPDRDA